MKVDSCFDIRRFDNWIILTESWNHINTDAVNGIKCTVFCLWKQWKLTSTVAVRGLLVGGILTGVWEIKQGRRNRLKRGLSDLLKIMLYENEAKWEHKCHLPLHCCHLLQRFTPCQCLTRHWIADASQWNLTPVSAASGGEEEAVV
jgi:hypothetical protein